MREALNKFFDEYWWLIPLGVLLVFAVLSTLHLKEWRANLPCSEMSNWDVGDIPVRCAEHFGLRLPENE